MNVVGYTLLLCVGSVLLLACSLWCVWFLACLLRFVIGCGLLFGVCVLCVCLLLLVVGYLPFVFIAWCM